MTKTINTLLRGENPDDGSPFVVLNLSGNDIPLGGIKLASPIESLDSNPARVSGIVTTILNGLTLGQQDCVRDVAEQHGLMSILFPDEYPTQARECVMQVIDEWLTALSVWRTPVKNQLYWELYATVNCPVS